MASSSTSEPSQTPERTAGAAAAEEELIATERCGVVRRWLEEEEAGGGGGAGRNGRVCLPSSPPGLLIGLRAEKPMGRRGINCAQDPTPPTIYPRSYCAQ